MAKVTAAMVKELREKTGAKMLDSKNALEANDGDMEKAMEYLREQAIKRGEKIMGKDRHAAEGTIAFYQHHNAQMGVMVEINCETDFVSSNEQFQTLAKDIALQISSMNPKYISRDEVPAEVIAEVAEADRPDWYRENILLEQDFIKADKSVEQVLTETTAELGETIRIARFARFEVGELAGDAPEDDA